MSAESVSVEPISRRLAWAVAIAATFTMTVSQLDRTTLAVLAPTVTKELGITETSYGWLASAFSLAYLVATPLAGWWIDRAGARRGLVWSVLIWSSIAALHSLALGFGTLFILRIALGMAESPSYPGSAQTVARVIPARESARAFGMLFTGSSIGIMVAAPLASYLFSVAGWRVAFLGSATVGLAWIPLWIGLTRRRAVRARLDAIHVAPTATADAAPSEKLPWHKFLRQPNMLRVILAVFAAAPITGFASAWGAKYLDRTFAVKQADVGHFLWLPMVGFDLGAIVFGDLSSRQQRASGAPPRLLFGISALLGSCLVMLPLATSPWMAIGILAVAMSGAGGLYTLASSDVLSRVPRERVAFASSMLAASQSFILIIANPLIGMAVTHFESYSQAAIALAAWVIPGSVVWILWRPSVVR